MSDRRAAAGRSRYPRATTLTTERLDAFFEASKDDHTIIVGSDVRELVGEIRRLDDALRRAVRLSDDGTYVVVRVWSDEDREVIRAMLAAR